ncbi:hypothetical protein LUZ60_011973 [Juncus effusus]|nr:hypothetical protein LUZ60_011973 [Juncus effusus]
MAFWPVFVFLVVTGFQLASRYLELLFKKGSTNEEQAKLRQEINQLLKEASSLSTPSTFAQAAMLRRKANTKEKELNKMQEENEKVKRSFHEQYTGLIKASKVVIYGALICWFWSSPVASVPKNLLQPFGWLFSFRAGRNAATGQITVGIIPWLVLTSRVSKFLCQKLPDDLFI